MLIRERHIWHDATGLVAPLALAAAPAAAQGISPPAGLLEAYLFGWGLCGIVAGILLVVAFGLESKGPRRIVAGVLVLAALLYSLIAIAAFFLESEGGASKFAGTIGFAVLAGVARYCFRQRRRLAAGSYGLIVIALATLLLIPNSYWEMPLLTFTRIVYEDNLADAGAAGVLRTPYGYGGRLALADGRLLIQTQHVPERPRYRGQSDRPTYSNGVVVTLEPVESTEPGSWFEIQHYDREYVSGAYYDGQRARYVLGLAEEHVNLYRRSNRTLGFLVDESARVSADDILIGMLRERTGNWGNEPDRSGPGNKHHWAELLVERNGIDLESPEFLDRALASGIDPNGLMGLWPLGLSPTARDSRGNTILHFAAAQCSGPLLRFLSDKPIDPTLRNGDGRTALEILSARAAANPGQCSAALRYFDERLAPAVAL